MLDLEKVDYYELDTSELERIAREHFLELIKPAWSAEIEEVWNNNAAQIYFVVENPETDAVFDSYTDPGKVLNRLAFNQVIPTGTYLIRVRWD